MSTDTRAIDLLDGDFYVNDPYPTYAWMREHEPVYWDATNELLGHLPLRRHRRDREAQGHLRQLRPAQGRLPAEHPGRPGDHRPRRPAARTSAATSSPAGSRPGRSARGSARPRGRRPTCSTRSEAKGGEAEIVDELAAPLPAMMIGRLLGFDEDRWPELQDWSERTIVLGGGPRYFTEDGMVAAMEFAQASSDLYEAKKALPGRRRDDDLDPGRDRRPAARRSTNVISDCLLHPRRRRRDDAHRHRAHDPEPDRAPRRSGRLLSHGADLGDRDGGVHPLRHADPQHVPRRDRRLRASAARPVQGRRSRWC